MQFFGVDARAFARARVVKSSVGTADFGLPGGPRISFYPRLQTPQCLNVSIPRTGALTARVRELPKSEQLLTVDLLARASMKNAANCDK